MAIFGISRLSYRERHAAPRGMVAVVDVWWVGVAMGYHENVGLSFPKHSHAFPSIPAP